jgi:putative copper export protein/methionine-rich copper-binding protein CopC
MRSFRACRLGATFALLALLVAPALPGATGGRVLAHAQLVASSPGAGAIVPESPDEIRLVFSEPLEEQVTSVDVVDVNGEPVLEGVGGVDATDPYALFVADPALPDGVYLLRWRTLSAADGHTAEGFFNFGIGDVPGTLAGGPQGMTHTETDAPGVIGRWLTYVGLLLALGMAIFHRVVIRSERMSQLLVRALGGALLVAAAASLGVGVLAGVEAGAVLEYLVGTRNGSLQLARAAVAAAGGMALFFVASRGDRVVTTRAPASGSSKQPSSSAPETGAVSTIAGARAAAKNAPLTLRGLVTLGSGTVDRQSAVIQDATGAILLRLGDTKRSLRVGQLVEVLGVRSTKSGMAALRSSRWPRVVGTGTEPEPRTLRTGDAGESAEAQLVVARGAVVASSRRASSGTVSFDIDDGSGPLRVVAGPKVKVDRAGLNAGAWFEVRGVLARQETAGSQPRAGYRIWPRAAGDIQGVTAPSSDTAGRASSARSAARDGLASLRSTSIAALDRAAMAAPAAGIVAAATGMVGIALLVLSGHAAALPGFAPLTAQVVHVIAAAIWVGGIVGILALVRWPALIIPDGARPGLRTLVPRFSALALVSIGLLGLTGVYSAWSQTGALISVETEYGRTLLMKAGFAVGALTLGGLNYLDGGRMMNWLDGFRTRVTVEVMLAATVLALTAALATTPPVEEADGIAIEPIPDAFGEVAPNMSMAVSPGRPGVNRIVVTTNDALAGTATIELSMDDLEAGTTTRVPLALEGMTGMDHPGEGMGMRHETEDGTVDWTGDAIVLPPGSQWDTSVLILDPDGNELGRQRFGFALDDQGITDGQMTSLLDPAIAVAALLLLGGGLAVGLGLGGWRMPRCEPLASRVSLIAGGGVAAVLGTLIGVSRLTV